MKVHFDEKTDALYIRLTDAEIIESEEIKPGIVFDFDAQGQIAAIEILRARSMIPLSNLRQMLFEVAS